MEIIGNGSYAHRLMALSRRQLSVAEYSEVKHNWYVDQPCKFLFLFS